MSSQLIVVIEAAPGSRLNQDGLTFLQHLPEPPRGVFFTLDGVRSSQETTWNNLKKFSFILCSGSCHEAGILTVSSPFKIGGLALLAEWQTQSAQIIRF